MARNPAIDPPRFVPPTQIYSSANPSPSSSRSPSPSRHHRNFSQSYDPLGRDLSPTRTLKAFTSAPGSSDNKGDIALVRLIEKASTSERAFGIRIAQTCKDIKVWHNELQQWPWTDSFEPPANAVHAVEGPYWGSLRENQVIAYERRIQDIREALFDQDVDGLKDYVLSQHIQPTKSSDYEHLDDFTALITATILHALPDLSRLDRLLNTWSIRVTLLRKIPGYLRGLEQAKSDLDNAWSEMGRHLEETRDTDMLRRYFLEFQEQLESRMGKVGGRLDAMLDDLEGREETLPDDWIDSFEALEASHGEWLTQTERHIAGQNMSPKKETPPVTVGETAFACGATPDQAPEVVDLTENNSIIVAINDVPAEDLTTQVHADAPQHLVESPILGTSSAVFLPDVDESSDLESDNVSQDLKKAPTVSGENTQAAASINGSVHRAGSLKSLSPGVPRSRHVPIFVNYDEETSSPSSSAAPTSVVDSPTLPADRPSFESFEQGPPSLNKVRARAAFLNGGIERTQSLQKSVNSPVRPFEHASMAFTKLFNKTNNAANSPSINSSHSRTSSASSRSSARKGLGLGIKSHEGFRHFHRSSSLASHESFGRENEKCLATGPSRPNYQPPNNTTQVSSPAPKAASRAVSQPVSRHQPFEQDRPMDAYVTPELHQDYFPSTQDSKSTIDTDWNSPAPSDFPENWPLPVKIYGDEISTLRDPMDSDMFERMFVDSLPGTPQGKSRPQSQESNPFEKMLKSTRSMEPLLDDAMLGKAAHRRSHSGSSSSGGSRPKHVSKPSATSLSFDPISELPTPASFDATPEIQSASASCYFKAKQVQTVPGNRPSPGARSSGSRGSNGTAVREGEEVNDGSDERDVRATPESRPTLKRASVTSIENHSRSELNTIEIPDMPRRPSNSSTPPFRMPSGSPPEAYRQRTSSSGGSGSRPSSSSLPHPTLRTDTERSLAANTLGASKPPPLNLSMPKRRLIVEQEATPRASEFQNGVSETKGIKAKHTRKESGAEQLDRHVSRVLNTLPSRIAFKPSFSNVNLDPSSASTMPTGPAKPRPALSNRPSRTGLTLSAAQPEITSRKANSADADGKMYHLTQEGREQPIKLFVRLVGEGERCMVRVGGGWADLGEYLRQYAEHHGHRTVSDGRLEVAPANNGSMRVGGGTKARTPLSRPGSVLDRPDSSMSFRSMRSSFGAANSTAPIDIPSSSPFSNSPQHNTSHTPTSRNSYYTTTTTPTPSIKSTSRPSTSDTFQASSPSSWSGQEIGLAGPASKPRGAGLDEQKTRWVEEMIGRAKMASVETRKKGEAWGDMGKVGGTRRIVFRHKTEGSG